MMLIRRRISESTRPVKSNWGVEKVIAPQDILNSFHSFTQLAICLGRGPDFSHLRGIGAPRRAPRISITRKSQCAQWCVWADVW